jgi:hypothetical protein
MTRTRSEITTEQWSKLNEQERRDKTRNASIATRVRKIQRQYDQAIWLLKQLGVGYEDMADIGRRMNALASKQHDDAAEDQIKL